MLQTVLNIIAVIGGIIAVATFLQNARLKRAEWLSQLHARFYESPTYKRVRHILDYQPDPEFGNLQSGVTKGGHNELAEAFVDY